MQQLLALAIAGAAGSVSRWALSGWAYRLFGERFAYGTLVVNVLGCFLLGAIMEASLVSDLVPQGWRAPITVGFLGAFTTFSTFGYETMRYFEDGAWVSALANVGANLILGFGATWLAFFAVRAVLGGA